MLKRSHLSNNRIQPVEYTLCSTCMRLFETETTKLDQHRLWILWICSFTLYFSMLFFFFFTNATLRYFHIHSPRSSVYFDIISVYILYAHASPITVHAQQYFVVRYQRLPPPSICYRKTIGIVVTVVSIFLISTLPFPNDELFPSSDSKREGTRFRCRSR